MSELPPTAQYTLNVTESCPVDIFAEAKAAFEQDFPLILFMIVEETLDLEISMIKNSTFIDQISLLSNVGKASSFIEAAPDNSKLTIKPTAYDEGEYKIKMTVTDGVKTFTKEMSLTVKGLATSTE